jgi:hypothetical protein
MNHMTSIALSAGLVCERFTALLLSVSRAAVSILQILRNKTRLRTCGFTNVFDSYGTLQARAPQGLTPSRLRVARGVAFAIGIALSTPMAVADGGSIDAIKPKDFIRMSLDQREASCLIKLYGKESAFNPYAIGNLDGKYHTYGIPQIKNAIIADKTPIQQVQYGLKYIDHRYQGDTCKAWTHWLRVGWH